MAEEATTQAKDKGLRDMMRLLGDNLNTRTVFGEPEVLQGRAIIPVAKVSLAGGGGFGSGPPEGGEEEAPQGVGGGGALKVKPLGVIEVTADGVRWVPIVDVAKLIITCVLGGIAVGMMGAAMGGCAKGCCRR